MGPTPLLDNDTMGRLIVDVLQANDARQFKLPTDQMSTALALATRWVTAAEQMGIDYGVLRAVGSLATTAVDAVAMGRTKL